MYTARDTQSGISRVFVNYLSIICQRRAFFLKKDESFLFDNCERCTVPDLEPGRAREAGFAFVSVLTVANSEWLAQRTKRVLHYGDSDRSSSRFKLASYVSVEGGGPQTRCALGRIELLDLIRRSERATAIYRDVRVRRPEYESRIFREITRVLHCDAALILE